jgi:hypothetical protein
VTIKRYLSEENLKRIMKEKRFLIKNIISSEGELQLCLRENYFNIYYRGNSLAKVEFQPEDKYTVGIHNKFVPEIILNDSDFSNSFRTSTNRDNEEIYNFNIEEYQLRKILKKDYIENIKSKIRYLNFKEELEFQHNIIASNILNEKYCLIDIQVTDNSFNKKRIDMIALRNIKENEYGIVVCEVKLGNNEELSNEVYNQVKGYSKHVRKNFNYYKKTYEKQYFQLKQLGLIPAHKNDEIAIKEDLEEMIIVGRYLVSAKKQIGELVKNHPDIKDKIRLLTYEL